MRITSSLAFACAAFGLVAASPASAGQGAMSAGAAVRDTAGGAVGTVVRVDGDHLVVRTDKHEARLPASSFAPKQGGLVIALTRADINARVERAKADAQAKIAPGASVRGAGGDVVGTVEAVDEASVTLRLSSGGAVRLPRGALGVGESGVFTRLTPSALEQAASQAPRL